MMHSSPGPSDQHEVTEYKMLENSPGYTSTIYHLPGSPPRVCKSINKEGINTHFPVEREAYERFSAQDHQPSGILKYYGIHDTIPAGIILEFAEKGNLWQYQHDQLCTGRPVLIPEVVYRWALQAAEALEFAHGVGVCNSDLNVVNMFLDRDLNLKVGDWAGAAIDGGRSYSSYRLRHQLYDVDGNKVAKTTGTTVTTEIFALGTVLYTMMTFEVPWPELREPRDDEVIKQRLREKDFPDTSVSPFLGEVIRKCWFLEFSSMTEVKNAVEAERAARASEESFWEPLPIIPVSEMLKRKAIVSRLP